VLNGVGQDYLEGITLSDIHVKYEGGGTAEEAAREVPAIAGEYFEIGTPPAYGVYARNVKGLTMRSVRLEVASADLRPAMVFDHVENASVVGLSAQGNPQSPLLRFRDSRDALLSASQVTTPSRAFLEASGAATKGIVVDGGMIGKAARAVELANGAAADSVTVRK
jgi:hypothetical protein